MTRSVQCAILPGPHGFLFGSRNLGWALRYALLAELPGLGRPAWARPGRGSPNSAASRRSGAPTGAHPLYYRTIRRTPPPAPRRKSPPMTCMPRRRLSARILAGTGRPQPTRHQALVLEPSDCRSGRGLLPTGLHTVDGKWALMTKMAPSPGKTRGQAVHSQINFKFIFKPRNRAYSAPCRQYQSNRCPARTGMKSGTNGLKIKHISTAGGAPLVRTVAISGR